MIKVHYNDLDAKFFDYVESEDLDVVKTYIDKVRTGGDRAVLEISEYFGEKINNIELTENEIKERVDRVPTEIIKCLKMAIKNVKTFAEKQFECLKELSYSTGESELGHKIIPLERIGAYVPGGRYPLPSSAIMTIVPARVVGAKEILMCSPRIQDATIAAAVLSGVDRIFNIGGAQAIASMAYGTETIPAVDKIVGPGNKYVTYAKKLVYGKCGIDFMAGPSEIMIVADETARVDFIAADLLSQAEHDPEARSILVTTSRVIANKTEKEVYEQLQKLPTRQIAEQSLQFSHIIIVDSLDQAIEIANKKAPEHLQLCFHRAQNYINAFTNYGSLFVGNYAAEVFGDYCSGTNHVLPTNGIARYSGGLSVFDYLKIQTYQIIAEGHARDSLIPVSTQLADIEGLMAHKNAATIRM